MKLQFTSDYLEGAHPAIIKALTDTNLEQSAGYGLDGYSEKAREKIRKACSAPEAEIYFLAGGTQANATVIDALLRSYQGVISADTGHITHHEAGAIEHSGHKVLTVPQRDGKVSVSDVEARIEEYLQDKNNGHAVMPGMVYISHPTEYGTLYTLSELEALSALCKKHNLPLYLDGARLAYALGCPANDVTLPDLARLCDVFYIGGTKCGTLFGEAVVIPKNGFIPHMFSIIKQHGALLAKGRIAAIQFDVLFTDGLYEAIGTGAIEAADRIRQTLKEKGYDIVSSSPTNQILVRMENRQADALAEKVSFGFWRNVDENHVVMRIATSWATTKEQVDALCALL